MEGSLAVAAADTSDVSSSDVATPAAAAGPNNEVCWDEYGWYSCVNVGGLRKHNSMPSCGSVWVPLGTEVWAGYRGAQWCIFAGIDSSWRQHENDIKESSTEDITEPRTHVCPAYGMYAPFNVGGLTHNGNPSIENIWVPLGTDVWTGYQGGQWRQEAGGHQKGWREWSELPRSA